MNSNNFCRYSHHENFTFLSAFFLSLLCMPSFCSWLLWVLRIFEVHLSSEKSFNFQYSISFISFRWSLCRDSSKKKKKHFRVFQREFSTLFHLKKSSIDPNEMIQEAIQTTFQLEFVDFSGESFVFHVLKTSN